MSIAQAIASVVIRGLPEVRIDIVSEGGFSRDAGRRASGVGQKTLAKEALLTLKIAVADGAVGIGDRRHTAFIEEGVNAGFVNLDIDGLARLPTRASEGDRFAR